MHNIGLEEVTNIQEGVKDVIVQLGQNVSFREFSSLIREDASQVQFILEGVSLLTHWVP